MSLTTTDENLSLEHRIYKARLKGAVVGGIGGYCIGGPPGGFVGGIAGASLVDFYFACNMGYSTGYFKIHQDFLEDQQILMRLAKFGVLAVHDGVVGATFGYVSIKAMYLMLEQVRKVACKPHYASGFDLDKVVEDFKSTNPLIPKDGIWERYENAAGTSSKDILNQEQNLQETAEEKAARDNRANQLNPNHTKTGQGRKVGYHGSGTKGDLDNHSNQLNPNNDKYQGGEK